MESPIPYQINLFTGQPEPAPDVVSRVRFLLQTMPETRDSYAELVGRYWMEFDGLADVLPPDCHDRFLCWLAKATSWKTVQNRAMELQNRCPELEASPAVAAHRERQATQGIVR